MPRISPLITPILFLSTPSIHPSIPPSLPPSIHPCTPFIDPLTVGALVPKFLRSKHKVRNRKLTKPQTEKMVREIWAARRRQSAVKEGEGDKLSLLDATHQYLVTKVGAPSQVIEMGYALLFGVWKYQYDADCELFLKVLTGDVIESMAEEQESLLLDVTRALKILESPKLGGVTMADATLILRELFRVGHPLGKSADNFEEMIDALHAETPASGIVRVDELFVEDKDFNQGRFAECVRDQYMEESVAFYSSVQDRLGECADEHGLVTQAQVRKPYQKPMRTLLIFTFFLTPATFPPLPLPIRWPTVSGRRCTSASTRVSPRASRNCCWKGSHPSTRPSP